MRRTGDAPEALRAQARRLADSYIAHGSPSAILLVGSAATGDADAYSDLDLIVYYDTPVSEQALAGARNEIGADRFSGKAFPEEGSYGERYYVGGVQCQVGHAFIDWWEREIDKVVVDLDLDERLLKALSGLLEGLPLHGAELIEQWRARAAYTEPLQRAMIQKHWKFFPWWYFAERLRGRDATVWRNDVFVQSAYNVVGVLAALNQVYFSTFEFKRARRFLARLDVAPPDLAARLDALFESDERQATAELERLVADTHALAGERFPDLDLSFEWGGMPTPPGARESPWL